MSEGRAIFARMTDQHADDHEVIHGAVAIVVSLDT